MIGKPRILRNARPPHGQGYPVTTVIVSRGKIVLLIVQVSDFRSSRLLTATTMAWRSGGKTNMQLISNMKSNGLIKSERILMVSKK